MSDLNLYLQRVFNRLLHRWNWPEFVGELFAARRGCEVPPEAWRRIVPTLVETVRPLIDGIGDPRTRYFQIVVLAAHLDREGFVAEAAEWKKRVLDAVEKLDPPLARCNTFVSFSRLFSLIALKDASAAYLKRAADEAEKLDDSSTRCRIFGDYGRLLNLAGRTTEAAAYFKRAADATAKLDPLTRCNAFGDYGQLLRLTGQLDEATAYLKPAADEAEKLKSPLTRCNAFGDYGQLLRLTGQLDEAAAYLKRAADAAAKLDDPLTRCNAARDLASFHRSREHFAAALDEYGVAQGQLHTMLATNRYPQGIGNFLAVYGDVFDFGLYSADRVYMEGKSPDVLFHGVAFADGLKAVSVREGLRRHSNHLFDPPTADWSSGPAGWKRLFKDGGGIPHTTDRASRSVAVRAACAHAPVLEHTPTILELPDDDADETKGELSLPVSEAELFDALPDDDTVAVVFHFLRDHLYVLPVRRGADGKPAVVHAAEGYFVLDDVRPKFDELLRLQAGTLAAINDLGWYKDGAAPLRKKLHAERKCGGFDLKRVAILLSELLRLDQLLGLIEPDAEKWATLHLVLLPDGPLYGLPLHAATVTVDKEPLALIEAFGSVRYALSLRTLRALGKVESEHAAVVPLRGAAFVSPSGTVCDDVYGDRLGFAAKEVEHLVDNSPPDSWRIFGESGAGAKWVATRANMKSHHQTATLLWSACHGGLLADTFTPRGFDEDVTVVNPSLLLADGPLSTARMVSEGYDLRGVHLWHNSCCLLGRLESADGNRQVEGYIAALTLLGCRRVTSAMWELADNAAARFAKHFLLRLQGNVFDNPNRSPHAVAVSLKEAMADFRDDKTNGDDFDHPYYWAPYTLYGLG